MTINWNEPGWSRDGPPAVRLFCWFSRFEYALKKARHLKKDRYDNPIADSDWDGFANKLGEGFFEKMVNEASAKVLFDSPPKHQIVRSGILRLER